MDTAYFCTSSIITSAGIPTLCIFIINSDCCSGLTITSTGFAALLTPSQKSRDGSSLSKPNRKFICSLVDGTSLKTLKPSKVFEAEQTTSKQANILLVIIISLKKNQSLCVNDINCVQLILNINFTGN